MNHKLSVLAACLFTAGILTACGTKLENAYSVDQNTYTGFLDEEKTLLKAEGFATDLCVPVSEENNEGEGVNAEAFAYFDTDGNTVTVQKNIYASVYPASTTKILTCMLAIENCDLEEEITVPEESRIDVAGSSNAGLKPGDRMKMKDMLYALMVPSGNDAAVAIAVHISGSVEKFAELMNERANELGATGSHFVNPHGLPDEDHYTTVYDMYLIFNEASKYDVFRQISKTKEYTALIENSSDSSERNVTWTSGNGFYNGKFTLPEGLSFYGGKTGHTNAAGYCLVLGEKDEAESEFISVIMNAPTYDDLYSGTVALAEQ